MADEKTMTAIYDNFDVFYTMCLSATLLSTYNSHKSDKHSHSIISFIGNSFNLQKETIDTYEKTILGDMMNIGLFTDYQAISSTELLTDEDKENIELYEIKGRVLEEIAIYEAQNYNVADVRIANQIKLNMKYEYFHHPYNPRMKFWETKRMAKSGCVGIVRQLGLLNTLGIGCCINYKKAEDCFLKCVLWGDTMSAVLLNQLYTMAEHKYDKKLKECQNLSKLLKLFIISPRKDPLINNELAETLISNHLNYDEKVELVTNFNDKTWKNILFLDNDTNERTIGFKVN